MNKFTDQIFRSRTKTIFFLLLPAIVIYYKSLFYGFSTLDEQWMILDNIYLKNGWTGLKQAWTHPMAMSYYRPLLATSFHLDYLIGRLSPTTYHFTNLVLHLLCVATLFRFLELNKLSRHMSFVLALLFSVHPVALHAVTWVPGRNDLLLCLFTLISLNSLLRFFDTEKKIQLVPHFLFFICALLTKESAVVLPFIFTFYQVIYKRDKSGNFLILIIGWVVVALAWFLLREQIVTRSPELSLNGVFLRNFIPGFLLFIGKAIFPVQQSVLPTLNNSVILPGIITTLVLTFLIFKPGLKDKPLAWLGLIIFFSLLVIPVWSSATKSGGEYYEHRMYTSMAGLALFVSQLRFNWNDIVMKGAVLVLLCLFCYRTFNRENVYKNENSFIMAGASESPDFHLFLFQKSGILFAEKQYDSALVYVNKAIAMRKDKPQMFVNRGSIYYMLGYYKESIADFTEAIRLSPAFDPRMYLDRNLSYCRIGQSDSAMRDLQMLKKCCQNIIPPEYEAGIGEFWKEQHPDK